MERRERPTARRDRNAYRCTQWQPRGLDRRGHHEGLTGRRDARPERGVRFRYATDRLGRADLWPGARRPRETGTSARSGAVPPMPPARRRCRRRRSGRPRFPTHLSSRGSRRAPVSGRITHRRDEHLGTGAASSGDHSRAVGPRGGVRAAKGPAELPAAAHAEPVARRLQKAHAGRDWIATSPGAPVACAQYAEYWLRAGATEPPRRAATAQARKGGARPWLRQGK